MQDAPDFNQFYCEHFNSSLCRWGISSNGRAPASHTGMRFHHTCYDVILPRSESTLPVLVRVDILNSDFALGVAEINYNRLIAPILN